MARLNVESFLDLVRRSGLVEHDRLSKALSTWAPPASDRSAGADRGTEAEGASVGKSAKAGTAAAPPGPDLQSLADHLVACGAVTRWQCGMLLRGRHRGFMLGKYKLLEHLGTGGMSTVYLAEHTRMRQQRAVKVLPQNRVNDSSYLERFYREARAAGALRHPHIVQAYDADNDGNNHYLVMEYIEGLDLQQIVKRHGKLPHDLAAEFVRQAALGLAYAHSQGVIHRDVKPANLLVDRAGTLKLLDMGLARYDREEQGSLTIAHDENVLGTADYLAPEQALNSHDVDSRADLYGLGGTLYFMLTGHPPFPDGTLSQRLMKHQTEEPASVLRDRPDTPSELLEICQRLMSKKAVDRYQTAEDVSRVTAEWLRDRGATESVREQAVAATGPIPLWQPGGDDLPASGRTSSEAARATLGTAGDGMPGDGMAAADAQLASEGALGAPHALTDTSDDLERPTTKATIGRRSSGSEILKRKEPDDKPTKPAPKRLPMAKPLDPLHEFAIQIEPAVGVGSGRSHSDIRRGQVQRGWTSVLLSVVLIAAAVVLVWLISQNLP